MNWLTRLIALCLPFALAAAVITWVVGGWFPRWEYGKASFPADLYGWTQAERLELALVAVNYLEERSSPEQAIYLLEEQRKPQTDQPLYNEREIEHMLDVKRLTDAIRTGGWVLGVIVMVGLVYLLSRQNSADYAYRALWHGGLFTIALLLGIGGFLLLFWERFFILFHELLFPPDSWTFYLNDSLIRLFPEKLWFDCGVTIVGTTFALGLICALIGRYSKA